MGKPITMLKKYIKTIYSIYCKIRYRDNLRIGKGTIMGFNKFFFKTNAKIVIGINSIVEANFYFDKEDATIKIGDRTFIGGSKLIAARKIEIGDDVLISWGCSIIDHHSHSLNFELRKRDVLNALKGYKDWSDIKIKETIIENGAWIGFESRILAGVTIGEGAVVAAGSIVTKDVAPYTLVAGIPAKFIKYLDKEA